MRRRLVLWRHGQTAWNLERRAQGQIDVPLDEVGLAQARQAALRLAALQPTPQLTTMVNAADESTRIAADMLIEILAGGRPESPVVLHSHLVQRGST